MNKLECQICGKQFKSFGGLATHLSQFEKVDINEYYDNYLKTNVMEGICTTSMCSRPTKFININIGYLEHCSRQCAGKDPEVKKRHSLSAKKYFEDKTNRIRCSETAKTRWKSTKYRQNFCRKIKELWDDPNSTYRSSEVSNERSRKLHNSWEQGKRDKKKKSQEMVEFWSNPKKREEVIENMKKYWIEKNKSNLSLIMKKRWTDSKFRDLVIPKVTEALNKPETKEVLRGYMLDGRAVYIQSFIKNPSKPQVELFHLVQEVCPYPVLNYPCLNYSIDIAVPQLSLAIEYDGSYWHQEDEADQKRQKELEEEGWIFLRYRDRIPIKEEFLRDTNQVVGRTI